MKNINWKKNRGRDTGILDTWQLADNRWAAKIITCEGTVLAAAIGWNELDAIIGAELELERNPETDR